MTIASRMGAVAALMIPLLVAGACAKTRDKPRHLVLITVDTLRADRIGVYGYDRARTPVLDALATESIRFEQSYAHASSTLPSVTSLVTGRLPGDHGVYGNRGPLSEDVPTLGVLLRDAGFATAAFIGNYVLRPSSGLDRGFDSYTREFRAVEAGRARPENRAGPLTDEALIWLRDRDPSRRLFLWIHYQDPHGAYTPPDFVEPKDDDSGPILPKNQGNSGIGGIPDYQWLGHGRLAEYEARYDGEVAEVDRQVGRLLEALAREGILEDSVLALTADHGEAFGEENLYCAHGYGLMDVLLHVPLLLRIPGHAGQVRQDRVRLIDVAPTLLQVLGVTASALPGRSLLHDEGDRQVVSQKGRERDKNWRSVRLGDFELRERGSGESALIVPAGVNPPVDLRERLHATLQELAPWPSEEGLEAVPLSPEEREALKSLGYLD